MQSDWRFSFSPYLLKFREPGGTSRGVLLEKPTYFIKIENLATGHSGYGEVPFFPGLSKERSVEVEDALRFLSAHPWMVSDFKSEISCLTFGLETAHRDYDNGGNGLIFKSAFTDSERPIEINGLIWMGSFEKMRERIEEKIRLGFKCIKIKIGAIDWDKELELLRYIRERCGKEVTIRVDANGAFSPGDCLPYLEQLASLDVHSIEQPIPAGNPQAMREICRESSIPVALDEELIGIPTGYERDRLLDDIIPQFIILKPALCFGFSGMADWIRRAEERNIGWWITSALESSVGLNAIAQFAGQYSLKLPQGLGTGNLYTNNLASSIRLDGDRVFYTGFPSGTYKKELNLIIQN